MQEGVNLDKNIKTLRSQNFEKKWSRLKFNKTSRYLYNAGFSVVQIMHNRALHVFNVSMQEGVILLKNVKRPFFEISNLFFGKNLLSCYSIIFSIIVYIIQD